MIYPMLMPSLILVGVASALTCDEYAPLALLGEMKGSSVNEASGLARSRTRPGIWFTHNDAGGIAELYAFELDGTFVEAHTVAGAEFRDWEDLSAGPCPDRPGDCLYIGDIGDNSRTRDSIAVYVVEEPAPGAQAEVIATFPAFYPEGVAMDSEALFVHPRTGRIYLATKDHDSDTSFIFRFHHEPTEAPQELTEVYAWMPEPPDTAVTGGAWDPDGDRLVIRTYAWAFVWSTDPCEPEAHWGQPATPQLVGDSRGESIAFDLDGGMVAVTEGGVMSIAQLACLAPGPGSGPCDTGQADTDTDADGDTDTDTDADGDADSRPPDSPQPDSPEDSDTGAGQPEEGCGGCGGCGHAPVGALMAGLLGLAALRRRRA